MDITPDELFNRMLNDYVRFPYRSYGHPADDVKRQQNIAAIVKRFFKIKQIREARLGIRHDLSAREMQVIGDTVQNSLPSGKAYVLVVVDSNNYLEKRQFNYVSNITRESVANLMGEIIHFLQASTPDKN